MFMMTVFEVKKVMMSDDELMAKVQGGDIDPYNILYSRHADSLYKYIYLYLRQRQNAEDILQETFVRVYTKKHQFNSDKASFKTWLHRIAHRLCIDYYRKHSKYKEVTIDKNEHLLYQKNIGEEELNNLLVIEHYLKDLSKTDRSILILAYYQGFTGREISQILKIPEGTVKSKLHHLLKKLNKKTKRGGDHS